MTADLVRVGDAAYGLGPAAARPFHDHDSGSET